MIYIKAKEKLIINDYDMNEDISLDNERTAYAYGSHRTFREDPLL